MLPGLLVFKELPVTGWLYFPLVIHSWGLWV